MRWSWRLLCYLDALVRALDFACSTSQAVLDVDGVGFPIIDLIHGNWTSVFTCSTTVTLADVYFDISHFGVISF